MIRILLISIITILFFFCLYFFLENRKLKKKLEELEKQSLEWLETKISKTTSTDQISIQNISTENIPKVSEPAKNQYSKPVSDNTQVISQKEKINTSIPSSQSPKKETSLTQKKGEVPKKIYQKNTIHTQTKVTSPVSITNQDTIRKYSPRKYQPPKEDAFDMNKLTLDLNEFIKKSEKVVPKIKERPTSKDYLKEISEKMADELKPQTIELTDYEKEQEEHAIISYQELLAVKDKLIILDDDEDEDINFIDELKNFRNGL